MQILLNQFLIKITHTEQTCLPTHTHTRTHAGAATALYRSQTNNLIFGLRSLASGAWSSLCLQTNQYVQPYIHLSINLSTHLAQSIPNGIPPHTHTHTMPGATV